MKQNVKKVNRVARKDCVLRLRQALMEIASVLTEQPRQASLTRIYRKLGIGHNTSTDLERLGLLVVEKGASKMHYKYAVTPLCADLLASKTVNWNSFILSTITPAEVRKMAYGRAGAPASAVTTALVNAAAPAPQTVAVTVTEPSSLIAAIELVINLYNAFPGVPVADIERAVELMKSQNVTVIGQ